MKNQNLNKILIHDNLAFRSRTHPELDRCNTFAANRRTKLPFQVSKRHKIYKIWLKLLIAFVHFLASDSNSLVFQLFSDRVQSLMTSRHTISEMQRLDRRKQSRIKNLRNRIRIRMIRILLHLAGSL